MRKAGAWLLAAVLSLTLCACGQKARPTVGLGRFSGEQVSVYGGDWQPVSEVYSGPTYLALNAGEEEEKYRLRDVSAIRKNEKTPARYHSVSGGRPVSRTAEPRLTPPQAVQSNLCGR